MKTLVIGGQEFSPILYIFEQLSKTQILVLRVIGLTYIKSYFLKKKLRINHLLQKHPKRQPRLYQGAGD